MLFSYFVGQKKNPIPYDLKSIFSYVVLAAVLYSAMEFLPFEGILNTVVRIALLLVYVVYVCKKDFPLGKVLRRFVH